jgi:hypothetical protein
MSKAEIDQELLQAAAETLLAADDQTAFWIDRSFILDADGGPPDWLNQHAKDRGTDRQFAESDGNLQERIRRVDDAIHPAVILDFVQAFLDEAEIAGTAAMVELRRDAAYLTDWVVPTGTGGEFEVVGDDIKFTPDVKTRAVSPTPRYGSRLTISSANESDNDGTFVITGFHEDGFLYTNGDAVAEVDAGLTWTLDLYDHEDNILSGFMDSYLDRGFRLSAQLQYIIVILPYSTPAALGRTIVEALRQKRGAGVLVLVEINQVEP